MNTQSLLVFRRDGGNYYVFSQYPRSGLDPADATAITDYKVDLWDPVAAAYVAQDIQLTYVSAVKGFLSAARAKSELDSLEYLIVVHRPTSSDANIRTFSRFAYVSDMLKRQDEIEADVDAFQADFNTFEATNQTEHDTTQAAVANVDGDVAALDTQMDTYEANAVARQTVNIGEHDVTQAAIAAIPPTDLTPVISRLDHASYGLAALNTDLDLILARLGITNDVGGSTTAGTAMAKLNAILSSMPAAGGAITVALAP